MDRFHILTGAPGSGKTAVLGALPDEIHVVGEPARLILAEHRRRGFTGQIEPERFVSLLLQRSVEQWHHAASLDGTIVFDRGIPDCAAYASYLDVEPGPSLAAAERHRYTEPGLLLAPWEEIYTTDDERTMTYDMTIRFHTAVIEAYDRTGYRLEEMPQASIAERARFVENAIGIALAEGDPGPG